MYIFEIRIMKSTKKNVGDGKAAGKASPSVKKQSKPQFKKDSQKKRNVGKKSTNNNAGTGRPNRFSQAEERRLERIRQQNERRAEKEAKLMIAAKDKKRKMKIFAKKNRHGQPLMNGRMELLLEKIQKRIK